MTQPLTERLTAIRDMLQAHADVRAKALSQTYLSEVRDLHADALAQLADAVLELAVRVEGDV